MCVSTLKEPPNVRLDGGQQKARTGMPPGDSLFSTFFYVAAIGGK
jgi:hypothetical protein